MNAKQLLSFHGKQKIKNKYLQRLELHRAADEIIQGVYWEKGKGCAVGCTIHSDQHSDYEDELGIPRIIARLEDRIFEGLPNEEAKDFPIQFLSAIPSGKNLEPVWKKFFVWLLIDEKEGVIQYAQKETEKEAIKNVALLIEKSLTDQIGEADFLRVKKAAAAAAAAAAYAAAAAAAAAAYAAAAAAAAYAAAAAAAAAAAYAVDAAAAAYAAAYAVDAAAYAVDAAAVRKAVRIKKYQAMRDQLISLLKAA